MERSHSCLRSARRRLARSARRRGRRARDRPATLSGGRVKLSALRGHPVVVSFWGTYCPPCRDEFPELVRAYSSLSAAGLYVVGVNARDQELSTKAVQAFADEFSARFTIALDQRGKSRRDYLIFGLPTTIFIDSSGVIRGIHRGPIDRAALDSGLATIVAPR